MGLPECHATWELEESLPKVLVQQFNEGVTSASEVQTINLYGHISGTVRVCDKSKDRPLVKKTRMERETLLDDLEGYALVHSALSIMHYRTITCIHSTF